MGGSGPIGKLDKTGVALPDPLVDNQGKSPKPNKNEKVQVGQGDRVTTAANPTAPQIAQNPFNPANNIQAGTASVSLTGGGKHLSAQYNYILANKEAAGGISTALETFALVTTSQDADLYRALNGAANNPERLGIASDKLDRITGLLGEILSDYNFA